MIGPFALPCRPSALPRLSTLALLLLACMALAVNSQFVLSDADEKRNVNFGREFLPFGKRIPSAADESFQRDFMAFGKRSPSDHFQRDFMAFGKRVPDGFQRDFMTFGKRSAGFDRDFMAFGRRK